MHYTHFIFLLQQQLTDMKKESQLKSQQIEACNANISCLSKDVEALSHSLQEKQATVSQLGRELHLARSAEEGSKEDASSRAGEVVRLEKQLREKQWEAEDVVKERDARIAELEGQLAHTQSSMKTLQSDFERRWVGRRRGRLGGWIEGGVEEDGLKEGMSVTRY